MTKNPDVIAVSGFSRGGTSLVWNLLNSHPDICAPLSETNEIVENNRSLRVLFRFPTSMRGRRGRIARWWVDRSFHQAKLAALDHEDLQFKSPGEVYTKDKASSCTLALKSIDGGIRLTDGLLHVYPNLAIICVVRNGYAVLEGSLRRGLDPEVVGRRYARNGARMVELSLRHRRTRIVKFEDVLREPFNAAERMYEFVGLPKHDTGLLRLKAKGVIDDTGSHNPRFGQLDRYYWISRDEISTAVDPRVDDRQALRLDRSSIEAFLRHAEPVMDHFGYLDSALEDQ